jgi:hypothetical protein
MEGGTAVSAKTTRRETEQQAAEREAWEAYRESLRDLEGRDYEVAERASWERLQRALKAIQGADARV